MSKHYDYINEQARAQALWHQENTYAANNNPGPLYSIDTPPPTVSGSLHIGHIFSYTQTDILARFARMNGKSVFYPMGYDDNGLATERFVEKKRGISPFVLGREQFINQCLEETALAREQFSALWKSMGFSIDWNLHYSTISPEVQKISQLSFVDLYKKGHIYRHQEPALYCTACRTSVAQAELDDNIQDSTFNDIVFMLDNGTELLVGTTRPELLPSCVALFYHPDDERYQHLAGKKARVPVYNNYVPILADDHVQPTKGTGLVMCCTFGDKTDIYWTKTHKLAYKQSIGLDGKWLENTGILAGLKATEARKTILEKLGQENLLRAQKPINHSVNVHERCKKEIEYLVISQWFLHILKHKERFLALADEISWNPSFMKTRYKNWVENLSWDWCLSRQRFYGIPFPVWHCTACSHTIVAQPEELPLDPQNSLPHNGACPSCSKNTLVAETDVMDTWNTSSLTPYINRYLFTKDINNIFSSDNLDEFLPMSMRPQAHDIIRTWAFYTIIKAALHNDIIPWKDIVISGHVLSDSKEKISKSKNNANLDPINLLKNYPADVIRYWTASGNLGHDVSFSDNQLKIGQRLLTKIWNAFRFIAEHIRETPPQEPDCLVPLRDFSAFPKKLGLINEWILHRAYQTYSVYNAALARHEFGIALTAVEQFFWHDLCDNYLELIKDQLFKPDHYDRDILYATRWTLYNLGLRILQLFAPYMPHVTETLYQDLYRQAIQIKSLHQTKFSAVQTEQQFQASAEQMVLLLDLVSDVRKLKSEQQLSLRTEIAVLTLATKEEKIISLVKQEEALIKGALCINTMHYSNMHSEKSLLIQEGSTWHATLVVESQPSKANH